MPQFTIKQNDGRPVIEGDLSSDVLGATVRFRMATLDGVMVIDAPVTNILNATTGIVTYQFTAQDVQNAGIFRAWFRATYSDGKIETYPNSDNPDHPPLWVEIPSQNG